MASTKRDVFRNALKRSLVTSKKLDAFDKNDIQSFLVILDDQWKKFDEAQSEVECTCASGSLAGEENQRAQGEEWYRVALSNFTRHMLRFKPKPQDKPQISAPKHAEVKLPTMDLPHFSGDPAHWRQFRDIFSALIHNEETLAGSQKLHFLRCSLQGEALNAIKALPITDENYKEAWDLLAKRYNVERIIVDAHFRALFELPKLTMESSSSIRSLLDNTQEHYRSLKTLGRPVLNWDDWLVHLTISKLDRETHRQWELSQKDHKVPTFQTLVDFLEARCHSLDAISSHKPNLQQSSAPPARVKSKTASAFTTTKAVEKCAFCGGKHRIYACDKYRSLSVADRVSHAAEKSLCNNCLSSGHNKDNCLSRNTCRLCKGKHHTLLHLEKTTAETSIVSSSHVTNTYQYILLGTAIAKVKDVCGLDQIVRILFDSASHLTFITRACVERLQLHIKPSSTKIEGIGATDAGCSRGAVQFSLSSLDNSFAEAIHANVLSKITNSLPPARIQIGSWPHIEGLNLADPNFNEPAPVDILLGCDHLGQFLLEGFIRGPHDTPVAQQSVLGWVLFGRVVEPPRAMVFSTTVASYEDSSLTRAVSKFWQLEELPESTHLTDEELMCEDIFAKTHSRQPDGRFIVKLPFKAGIPLGSSRGSAIRALLRMEREFAKDPQLHTRYADFMQEFIDLGHMEEIADTPKPGEHFYMPHRAVIKESSSTTKLRVVFNASSKTSSGYSLNDTQMVGPQLQPDLFTTLLRFRTHRFAMSADVAKMYRQVRVDESHVDFQRIVWRKNSTEEIKDFRLLTVTYGVASASHLAVKALQQVAIDEEADFPAAAKVVHRDFYMDDLLTGSNDERELQCLQSQVTSMLLRGGFQLRKWSSNYALVLSSIPAEERELKPTLDLSGSESVKALGLQWQPSLDVFAYSVQVHELDTLNLTKRLLLSDAAKLFDPLGLLSPTTVVAKIIFQRLWKPKVDWNEAVPEAIKKTWLQYRENLPSLAEIKVPRWVGTGEQGAITDLHGFADASQAAFAAVIYARTVSSSGLVTVRLITAKTRVAPIKPISLSRLELCAAALLAQLMKLVRKVLDPSRCNVYGWTDSTVAIAWIRQHPSKWCTFVAYRVTQIQEVIPPANWFHVPSAQNPADCASRGLLPHELKDFALWWNGPRWLSLHEESWPPQQLFITAIDQRSNPVNVNVAIRPSPSEIWNLIDRYPSLLRLKYVTAIIFRFINNARRSVIVRKGGKSTSRCSSVNPSHSELQEALNFWIRLTQGYYFDEDIHRLQSKKPLTRQSRLLRLNPFLDDLGLLRVGGRLRNASISPDRKYPILLPAAAKLTKLICEDIHRISLHGGTQTMLAILQGRFWILNGRQVLRRIFKSCVKCRRYEHVIQQQLMSDLPKPRVESCRPFLRSGVDFAGPVLLRFSKGRGSKAVKGYIAIFICMSTGAMHLELAGDLSSATFVAVFKRFVSRRGHCQDLYSDNGTNFVGAERELNNFLREATQDERLAKFLINDGTTWHFNPPAAPHMGGYWEAAVKRVKFHLRRTLGGNLLTFEEFSTLLAEIEACVNSRPLCSLSTDVNDLQALTPGHFLIGEPLKIVPEPDITDVKISLRHRWRLITQLRQHFWRRWSKEYLVQLQQRVKWTKSSPNFAVGDLVIVREDNIPPSKWRMGRVAEVHAGSDGRVRIVTLKTADGMLKRPIVNISPLLTFKDNPDEIGELN